MWSLRKRGQKPPLSRLEPATPTSPPRTNERLAARRGGKRAVIAVAHAILVIAYHLLADGRVYVDLGPDYFDQRAREKVRVRLTKRLEAHATPRTEPR